MVKSEPSPKSTIPKERRLRITEIYASIQGESTHVGKPCVFVRLTGCNLRCTWCDSEFTFTGGTHMDIDDVVAKAHEFGVHTVEVTGGEPLAQKNAIPLMEALLARGHEVLLETSGSLPIAPVPDAVHVIMDLKAPDSGEEAANLWENIDALAPNDEVKFVLASRRDYDWAAEVVGRYDLSARCCVLFSPVWGSIEPQDLVAWVLQDGLDVRVQLQLHKVIWPADAQGV
jgi:7-carboxy-7-deazaguanine synthase